MGLLVVRIVSPEGVGGSEDRGGRGKGSGLPLSGLP